MSSKFIQDWSSAPVPALTAEDIASLAAKYAEQLKLGQTSQMSLLFELYRSRLLRLIEFRLHKSLHARVDPVDVLQESYIDAIQKLSFYISNPPDSVYTWLRLVVLQRIKLIHQFHLQARKRDASTEHPLNADSDSQFQAIQGLLADSITSPSEKVSRKEVVTLVDKMLEEMSENDREILFLRHFEQLSNNDVADVLGISATTASNRYIRALQRLKELLPHYEY